MARQVTEKTVTTKTPRKQPAGKRSVPLEQPDAAPQEPYVPPPEDAYQHGEDLLPQWRLNQLPWQIGRFHQWYKATCAVGIQRIVARVPEDGFMGSETFIHIMFNDIAAMFRSQRLDINLMAVWSLYQAQEALKTKQNICYINPGRTYAGLYRFQINRQSEDWT
ncbi:hypothetical protein ACP70R_041005 [Stipagrostis hirtigluma subsp. patula]